MNNVEFDASDFEAHVLIFQDKIKARILKGVNDVATEIMRLSQMEVPIDVGSLQNSGVVIDATDLEAPEATVGYNKVYAAYQHEGHRQDGSYQVTHYTNPRSKSKYLEDPIRVNLAHFLDVIAGGLA
jgi:hypothetical protein